jgi:hypothetical protein
MDKPRRAFYVRLAIAGFLLLPAGNVVMGLMLLALGQKAPPNVFRLLLIVSVIDFVAAAALWRTLRFLIAGLVLAIVLLLGGLAFGSFGLGHPDSFFDFVTSLLLAFGPFLALVGCSVALAQRRRGRLRSARPVERIAVAAVGIVFAAAAARSGASTISNAAASGVPPGATVVETNVDRFVPSVVRLDPTRRNRIFVVNNDSFAHTFTIDDFGLDRYVAPHVRRLIGVSVPPAALKGRDTRRFVLACYVTGHENMRGTVVVKR